MAIAARVLASGAGWQVADVVCSAGPHDRRFEERHEAVSVAAVLGGSFSYRSAGGSALLAAGSVLLGSAGRCFECGHEHGAGDRCLAFAFAPAFYEAVVAAVPGARDFGFAAPCLPASDRLTPLLAALEAARDAADATALEELGLRLAARAAAPEGVCRRAASPTAREMRRIGEIVRLVEARADETLTVAGLAAAAGMRSYRFLRCFQAVTGSTPYQYVLRLRMHRAAVQLRRSNAPVAAIAFEAGFGDLSTFNRRFRRVMGMAPLRFRAGG